MAETKRKKNETFESLIRRFNKRLMQSGKLIQKRKIAFHQRADSKTKVKRAALRRKEIGEQREYLRKTGKLKEDERRSYR